MRLCVDDEWFRIDLVFFHRRLHCLILIDLKLAAITAGDIGQMNLYLNYARHHWTRTDENPPVGLILCARHRAGVARYALEGLSSKILAAEYRIGCPARRPWPPSWSGPLRRWRNDLRTAAGNSKGKLAIYLA